jgi:hypothetical protein
MHEHGETIAAGFRQEEQCLNLIAEQRAPVTIPGLTCRVSLSFVV